MYVIGYLLTILLPIVSIPFSFIMIPFDYKNRKHYMIQNSVGLAFFAYCWNPSKTADLYVWQQISSQLSILDFKSFFQYMISGSEPLNNLLKYIAGLTGNYALLQFIVVLIGFLLLNNLIYHVYRDTGKDKPLSFFVIYSFLLASLLYVHFISGLFYMLAAIVFANGVYYIYNNKKILGIVLTLASFLIHSSMAFPILLFIIFYLSKSKLKIKNIILYIILALSIGYIIPALLTYLNHPIFSDIKAMYDGYFLNDRYNAINSGLFFWFNLISLFPIIYLLIFGKKDFNSMSKYGVVIILSSVLIYHMAPVFFRFIYLGHMLLSFSYFEYANNTSAIKTNRRIFFVVLMGTILLESIVQIRLLNSINFISIITDNLVKTIFSLIR